MREQGFGIYKKNFKYLQNSVEEFHKNIFRIFLLCSEEETKNNNIKSRFFSHLLHK